MQIITGFRVTDATWFRFEEIILSEYACKKCDRWIENVRNLPSKSISNRLPNPRRFVLFTNIIQENYNFSGVLQT